MTCALLRRYDQQKFAGTVHSLTQKVRCCACFHTFIVSYISTDIAIPPAYPGADFSWARRLKISASGPHTGNSRGRGRLKISSDIAYPGADFSWARRLKISASGPHTGNSRGRGRLKISSDVGLWNSSTGKWQLFNKSGKYLTLVNPRFSLS